MLDQDPTQHSAAVCSSHPSQVKETTLVGPQIVLTVLEGDQQVLMQDPDTWRLEWVGGLLHAEVGDPSGQLLQGFKAILEQFQGDSGGGEGGIGQTHLPKGSHHEGVWTSRESTKCHTRVGQLWSPRYSEGCTPRKDEKAANPCGNYLHKRFDKRDNAAFLRSVNRQTDVHGTRLNRRKGFVFWGEGAVRGPAQV